MQDRVPVNPGRVLVTPENGNAPYYATLTRADNPTQEGTPLNKASLLKDATAAKFGLGTDAVPDDVSFLLSRFHAGLGNEYVWAKYAVETDVETLVGYVNSPDPSAYPIDDGYTYAALGQLGAKMQIATGSYTGTGTYGADNPNSLTFDFAPKILFLFAEYTSGAKVMYGIGSRANADNSAYIWGIPCMPGETYNVMYSSGKYNTVTVSADGKAIGWVAGYNVDSGGQFNVSGWTYHYIAIG